MEALVAAVAEIDNSVRLDEAYFRSRVLSPRCFDSASAWPMTTTDRRRCRNSAYADAGLCAAHRMVRL